MLFEDDHYCLKCGATVSGLDNYISHRNLDCTEGETKKPLPEVAEDTPTEQFFSVLQLQRRSDVPVAQKSKGIVTRSKTKTKEDITEQRPVLQPKEKKRGRPKKLRLDSEKRCEEKLLNVDNKEEIDFWLDSGQERRQHQGGKNLHSEIFSMSPMYLPEDREVDKFLQDDYNDSYYQFIDYDDIQYDSTARTEQKGPGKSGSPNPWLLQTWDSLLDSEESERDGKGRRNCPPLSYTGGKWKPPESGGKFKSISSVEIGVKSKSPILEGKRVTPTDPLFDSRYPPESHTGGKWRLPLQETRLQPPEYHTGGKWKAPSSDVESHAAFLAQKSSSPADVRNRGLPQGRYPSPSHTGGKWTPQDMNAPPIEHTRGKWVPASPTKCLKTSGGGIQYYCTPCGRRLASKEMYKKHLLSDLHVKRLRQEKDLECDGRSSKSMNALRSFEARRLRMRQTKKPSRYDETELTGTQKKGEGIRKRHISQCNVCRSKVRKGKLGKHLVSYFHYRRANLASNTIQDQVLENMPAIIRHSPYQCVPCHFYCNTPAQFLKHWRMGHIRRGRASQTSKNTLFWCSFCDYRCRWTTDMAEHLKSEEHCSVIKAINGSVPIVIRQPKEIICQHCGEDCKLNVHLRLHERFVHGVTHPPPEVFNCPVCHFKGPSVKSLRMHVRRTHPHAAIPFTCKYCNLTFESAKESHEHRRTSAHIYKRTLANGNEKSKAELKRMCDECDKTFPSPADLTRHIKEKHPSKRYVCAQCGEEFARSQLVSRHARTCRLLSGDKPAKAPLKFTCKQCPFTCQWESDLLRHSLHHIPGNSKDLVPCPSCQQEFPMFKLRRHVLKHSSERKYICSDCRNSFRMKHHLVQHQQYGTCVNRKVEVKEKTKEKLVCNYCGYIALTNTLLKRHMACHEDVRTHPCPKCSFVAVLPDHLKRHMIIHEGIKPFKCPYCSYTCNLMENLRKHIMGKPTTHQRVYQCWHCKFGTNATKAFKDHMVTEHVENLEEVNSKIKVRFRNEESFQTKEPNMSRRGKSLKRKHSPVIKIQNKPTKPAILRPIPVEYLEEEEEVDEDYLPSDHLEIDNTGALDPEGILIVPVGLDEYTNTDLKESGGTDINVNSDHKRRIQEIVAEVILGVTKNSKVTVMNEPTVEFVDDICDDLGMAAGTVVYDDVGSNFVENYLCSDPMSL